MKHALRLFFATLILVLFVGTTQTFADHGHHYGEDKKDNKSSDKAPIDGGLSILLVAGLGLGAKKLFDQNKKPAA